MGSRVWQPSWVWGAGGRHWHANNSRCCFTSLQFIYCGKKATLHVGNVKPLGSMPEGTIVCNVEEVGQHAATAKPAKISSSRRNDSLKQTQPTLNDGCRHHG